MRLVAFFLCGLLCVSTQAAVYKKELPDGTVTYTDQPDPGAKAIVLPEIQTIQPPPKTVINESGSPSKDKAPDTAFNYTMLKIVSPSDNDTLRENAGQVEISLAIEPSLQTQAGHKILVTMDGKPIAEPGTSLQYVIENMDRGTHTLQAAVVDTAGNTLIRTAITTIYVKRHSILFQTFPASPANPATPASPALPKPVTPPLSPTPVTQGSP